MTFLEHLTEFRTRLMRSFIALAAASVIGLVYCKKIFFILQIPMLKALPEGSNFIATNPFESYVTYFKVAFLAGIFLASPYLFFQLWRFINPGLQTKEKKLLLPASLASAFLFVGGALFGYFVVFPAGFHYINLVLEGTAIRLMPSMSDYLSVASTLLLAFGVTFELPLFIFILGKFGLIQYTHIRQYRRYVVVVLFIVAAILTPGPDVLSQCLMAVPLWILYEVGGLTLLMMKKNNEKHAEQTNPA